MPAYWILKTEPGTYSHGDLVRAQRATWDGVSNPVALKHLRAMQPGDRVLIYHTGDEKAVVGQATVASQPYPDPGDRSGKLTVVDLTAGPPVQRRTTLAEIKADPLFADCGLVRVPRLSVVPLTAEQFGRLTK